MFCGIVSLRRQMNEAGCAGIPFLFIVDYAMERAFFTSSPFDDCGVLWNMGGHGNIEPSAQRPSVSLKPVSAPSEKEYAEAFATVRKGLLSGNSFLANLTWATQVECSDLKDLLMAAKAPYRLLIPDEFVCFSPESFVKVSEKGTISTYPMKGTIKADRPDAYERLRDNEKEVSEHYTIVDLLRNDLSMVATDVRVNRFRYFEKIETAKGPIYQTSSHISGLLPHGWQSRLGDIMLQLLPAGSICGAPKDSTLRLIRSAEQSERGWYTGVFGFFDGKSLDSAVMIRCVQRHSDRCFYFHSGGGITANSDVSTEYAELLDKVYLTV
ncbi:MAG: aminodeoxychorismate synthase component I [Candidatus Amulumruptor sp.]